MLEIKQGGVANSKTFEEVVERFSGYIDSIANKTGHKSRLYGPEDIVQELNIVLWRCYQKYGHFTERDFERVFVSSCSRRLATCFRRRFIRQEAIHETIDEHEGHWKRELAKTEYGDEFYKAGIRRIKEELDTKSIAIVGSQYRGFGRGRFGREEIETAIKCIKNIL